MQNIELNMTNKVYIIVLNWNGWGDTLECLDSLCMLNYPDYQIVIVDNGSTDDSVAKINDWINNNRSGVLLKTNKNLGFAAGNNVGLRWVMAKNDFAYVWILNNDTIVDPDSLKSMVDRMKAKPGAGMCGSAVLYYDQRNKIAAMGEKYDRWQAHGYHLETNKLYDPSKINQYRKLENKMDYVVGASMLVSRNFLHDIGLMCEDYFLYFEEIDWVTRAHGLYSLVLAPESIVYHKISKSFKQGDLKAEKISPVFDYYITKNRLLFTQKYFPYALPTVYLSIFGYLLDRIRLGAWKNVKVMLKAVLAHIRGIK